MVCFIEIIPVDAFREKVENDSQNLINAHMIVQKRLFI